eukprot:403338486
MQINNLSDNKATIANNISNEYLTSLKYSDPLLQNIKQICGEIDINIEESTGLIYEDELEQAQLHMQIALKKLNSAAPLFEKLNLRNQQHYLQGGPSTQSSSSETQQNPNLKENVDGKNNLSANKLGSSNTPHHQHTQSSQTSIAFQNEQLQKIYSVVINYNMAACFQRRGIFKESHEYILKSLEALRHLAQDNSVQLPNQNLSGRITPQTQQDQSQQQTSTSQKYKQLLYLRYYAQIILQSCAIKSQLQDHDGALMSAYDGLTSQSINSEYGGAPDRKRNEILGQSLKSDRSVQKTRVAGKSLSQKIVESPIQNIIRPQRQSMGGNQLRSSTTSSKISTPERQHSEGRTSNGNSVGSTSRRLKSRELRQQSITSSIRFHLSESEDEQTSLERIHTFNLKTDTNRSQSSIAKEESPSSSGSEAKSKKKKSQIKSLKQLLNVKVLKKGQDGKTKGIHISQSQQSQKLPFLKAKDIAIEGLEIDKFTLSMEVTKQRMTKLFKEFNSLSQIESLRKIDRYKYVGRNMLGVRKFDDWINNLEIGNIMHLNPITTQELMQNIGKHHEFQKDPMLKKLVLLSVSLFSIATEMRMMVQFDQKDKEVKDTLQNSSEVWHAQSVFFGAYYLPANCPLVTHIANSYNKHYIVNKKPQSPKQQQSIQSALGQKKESYQKNKVLQNFLLNQQTNAQIPPKVTLNNSISNKDKSLSYTNGGGGVSSSYENNTSDNQDHQVLTEQQKHRPIVSLSTISPMYTAVKRTKDNKLKIQLKKNYNSNKFQSESSVSPIRHSQGFEREFSVNYRLELFTQIRIVSRKIRQLEASKQVHKY